MIPFLEIDRITGEFDDCMEIATQRKSHDYLINMIFFVAATHDTSYQNDAGGIKSSSRWLSEATPSGHEV